MIFNLSLQRTALPPAELYSQMQSFDVYSSSTESAVRKLFEGIASYTEVLKSIQGTTFVSGQLDREKFNVEYQAWANKHKRRLEKSFAAQREFTAQSFAMATLCGSVLQVAAKAIECYSPNKSIPAHLKLIVGDSKSAIPFCIGREVRGLPIGLIIYAGRNQHTHFNEKRFAKVNEAVFDQLATVPGYSARDPALNLQNSLLSSYACNITFVLGWRTYASYKKDMQALLGEA
jgi:hypothetical protein